MNQELQEQKLTPTEPELPSGSRPPGMPSVEVPPESPSARQASENRLIAGIGLILLGGFALLAQLVNSSLWGLLFLPALGLFFTIWGFVTKKPGLLIPGGIIIGLAAGVALIQGPYAWLSVNGQGGVFLIALGAGFALVTIFAAFLRHWYRWALIPAAVLAVFGLGLLAELAGLSAMRYIDTAWPIALIILGIFLVLWRRSLQKGPPPKN